MAKVATLKRYEIEEPTKPSNELRQLATDAELILGYTGLRDSLIACDRESLANVLRRLEIKPYDEDTVLKYKSEAVEAAEERNRKEHPNEYRTFYWSAMNLRGCTADVPPFVLRKAIQIKRACPEVKMIIEYLTYDDDPFLKLVHGKEQFWVECWDEKDFEEKL
jgi:hypothetical protein